MVSFNKTFKGGKSAKFTAIIRIEQQLQRQWAELVTLPETSDGDASPIIGAQSKRLTHQRKEEPYRSDQKMGIVIQLKV